MTTALRPSWRALQVCLGAVLLLGGTPLWADDVKVQPAPGDALVVTNNSGDAERFKVVESGEVYIGGLLVTIDVGNTQTVMGLFEGEDLLDQWRLSTVRERTADEYKLFFAGLLRQDGHRLDDVRGVALSSVVPEAKEAMIAR